MEIKRKSLYDIALERKITTIGEILKLYNGKTVITGKPSVGTAVSSHNYPKKFKLVNSGYNSTLGITPNVSTAYLKTGICANTSVDGSGIYLTEIYPNSETREELEISITSLKKEYDEKLEYLNKKLEFINELGIDEYNEDTIKVIIILDKYKNSKNEDRISLAEELMAQIK